MCFRALAEVVASCTLCPRLVHHRQTVPTPPAFQDEFHWRRPVPGYGDPQARVLILGLAPSSVGANRTGRVFTGDLTAKFLVQALYNEGFANQPTSIDAFDGLIYKDIYLTASVKCVPPQHKPLKSEFINCSRYLEEEIFLLKNLKAVLALGKHGFDAYLAFLKRRIEIPTITFKHGSKHEFGGWPTLYGSYHPSPQNTNTGVMTMAMFTAILRSIKSDLDRNC